MIYGWIYQIEKIGFVNIGLKYSTNNYTNAYLKIFKNEEKIICRWIVKLKS